MLRIGVAGRDHSRAIDEVDTFHQRDVLPHFRLARDGSDGADLFLPQRVDDGRLAGVGVADEADGDLFAVGMQGGELAEKLDQGSFAKGVGDGGVESESGVVLG